MRGCRPGWLSGITPCTYIVGGECFIFRTSQDRFIAHSLSFIFAEYKVCLTMRVQLTACCDRTFAFFAISLNRRTCMTDPISSFSILHLIILY